MNLFLSQSKIAFGDYNDVVVEKFHQLHKGKFTLCSLYHNFWQLFFLIFVNSPPFPVKRQKKTYSK